MPDPAPTALEAMQRLEVALFVLMLAVQQAEEAAAAVIAAQAVENAK